MSDIYHELLNAAEPPMAILQESGFLLLDNNDRFAELCCIAPFQGGSLPIFGFPNSINAQLSQKIRYFKAGDKAAGMVWIPITMDSEPPRSMELQLKFYEASTGHLLVVLRVE